MSHFNHIELHFEMADCKATLMASMVRTMTLYVIVLRLWLTSLERKVLSGQSFTPLYTL